MNGILVAAPGSGAGKTTVAAALMAAFCQRGLTVQPFKCGPDFIDPGHHTVICRRPSHNIDSWMLPPGINRRIFASACQDADVAIVEGMMGLFDGVRGSSEEGSSAEIAKMFGLPVLLVVDASTSARSIAAVVHGFKTFDPDIRLVGVILNRVAGQAHAEMLCDALRGIRGDLWVGWLPHQDELRLTERYLGLQTAAERSWSEDTVLRMASLLEKNCALDRLLEACHFQLPEYSSELLSVSSQEPIRIGIARDPAFCFYYQAGLDELLRQGAEVVEFSPLNNARLPENLDALYFGGGHPELYAEALSDNKTLLSDLHEFARAGKPVYGECGGLIFLSRELVLQDGSAWPMAGLLPLSIQMTDSLVHFGYAEIEFVEDGLAAAGSVLRGHSFHCSKVIREGDLAKTAVVRYSLFKKEEQEGFAAGNVFGSYVHLHFAASPALSTRLVSMARSAREKCRVAR